MKISFVIPFHNECINAPLMLQRVHEYAKKKKFDFEIIPVDDRSSDGTSVILKEFAGKFSNIHPVFRKKDNSQTGNTMGIALLSGSRKAKGDYIIWTMGDMADDTETYTQIIKKLEEGYDMVFGSRYMRGGSRGNLDAVKAFFSSWGTKLARFLFSINVDDITNAFRGFKKEILKNVDLKSEGFSISPEFAIKAHLKGYKLGQVPTVYTNRINGVSSFKLFNMSFQYLKVYLEILKDRFTGKL